MERGDTARILESFTQGMTDAGADVSLFYASRLKVKPCQCGEMLCWSKHLGECCIKDDMEQLYAALRDADTCILATPVYIPLPGDMQNVINRLCPLINPVLERRDGRTRARLHDEVRFRRIALVATGGWWERENLDTVVRIARELAEDASVAFAGAVLRPHAFLMWRKGDLTEAGQAVMSQVRAAGHQLVEHGVMSADTLEAISRPLIAEDEFRRRFQ
jgi:multimeric flavodoxin WrbA